MSHGDGGKGDSARPLSVSFAKFSSNFDLAFKKPDQPCPCADCGGTGRDGKGSCSVCVPTDDGPEIKGENAE